MADLFTISVSSVGDDYSADYGSVTPYIDNLGTTTSDGTWIVRAPITGANAPYTKVKITALNTGSGFWLNNIDYLRFHFNDLNEPALVEMTKANFISQGVTHTFGPPGQYYFGVVAHTVVGGITSLYIANVIIDEIEAIPVISMFDENGDSVVLGVSAVSPYTVTFAATGTVAGSYKPDALTWEFADRTDPITVTRWEDRRRDFTLFGPPPREGDPDDPRNYKISHTYYRRSRQFARMPVEPSLTVRSLTTATTTTTSTSAELGPFLYPLPEVRNLIKTRCFGADNKVLLISENEEGQVYEHLIFNLSGARAPIIDPDE